MTNETLEKISTKLSAVRSNIKNRKGCWMGYTAPQLADDLAYHLSLAAKNGSLTPEQCAHFEQMPRADLAYELLREARDVLYHNRKVAGLPAERPFRDEDYSKKAAAIYKISEQLLLLNHGIRNDWEEQKKRRQDMLNILFYGVPDKEVERLFLAKAVGALFVES